MKSSVIERPFLPRHHTLQPEKCGEARHNLLGYKGVSQPQDIKDAGVEPQGGEPGPGSTMACIDAHQHEREQRHQQAASVFQKDAIVT